MNNKFFAQAEILVEIVRQGSMTAAAATLRQSKSSVSQKLAEMESDLDIVLLKRNTRSIELTAAGKRVYDLCLNAVDALQYARGEVSHQVQTKTPQGRVSISGSDLYLTQFIMPLLSDLGKKFPLIQIDLFGGDQPVDQRAEGVDLRIRVGDVGGDGMKIYPLSPMERVLCANKELYCKAQSLFDPEFLSDVPHILRIQEKPEWIFCKAGSEKKLKITNPVIRVNSYELSVEAVRLGLGAAILAKAVVRNELDDGSLLELLPEWKVDPIPVSMVVPLSRLRRPEVMAVTRYMANKL